MSVGASPGNFVPLPDGLGASLFEFRPHGREAHGTVSTPYIVKKSRGTDAASRNASKKEDDDGQ
jgi:hypothetical protein